jgi:Zn finger protein HypA/HybF involved in hydrogenase expression
MKTVERVQQVNPKSRKPFSKKIWCNHCENHTMHKITYWNHSYPNGELKVNYNITCDECKGHEAQTATGNNWDILFVTDFFD